MASLLRSLLEAGRSVRLVPHVLANPTPDDDSVPCAELSKMFPECGVAEPVDLWHVRRIIASGRVLVGSRMHACLNAISVGTPALPWAYSRKFHGLLDDLGWPFNQNLGTQAPHELAGRTHGLINQALSGEMTQHVATERLSSVGALIQSLVPPST
jgi:polysaccharide pyruvyl transferase WcaK-like protein